MAGEAIVADARHIDQAALHHVPAVQALETEQRADADEFQQLAPANYAFCPEEEKRQKINESHQPAEHPVAVLHVVDEFEVAERHAKIDLLVFRRLLVFSELFRPAGFAGRRKHAGEECHVRGQGQGRRRNPLVEDDAYSRASCALRRVVTGDVTYVCVVMLNDEAVAISFMGGDTFAGAHHPDTHTLTATGVDITGILQSHLWIFGVQAADVLVIQSAFGANKYFVQGSFGDCCHLTLLRPHPGAP